VVVVEDSSTRRTRRCLYHPAPQTQIMKWVRQRGHEAAYPSRRCFWQILHAPFSGRASLRGFTTSTAAGIVRCCRGAGEVAPVLTSNRGQQCKSLNFHPTMIADLVRPGKRVPSLVREAAMAASLSVFIDSSSSRKPTAMQGNMKVDQQECGNSSANAKKTDRVPPYSYTSPICTLSVWQPTDGAHRHAMANS
jgi:hypothetical protein